MLADSVDEYLRGAISDSALRDVAWSVVVAWEALPARVREGEAVQREDVLWHAVWTIQHLADAEHREEGVAEPALLECLRLLESDDALPQGYSARHP